MTFNWFLPVLLLTTTTAHPIDEHVTLTDNGIARCVIVVPEGSLTWPGDDKVLNRWSPHPEEPERARRLKRDSIRDLAHYLRAMTGTAIEIVETRSPDDRRIPIYIGSAATQTFGPVGISYADRFGFRVVVTPTGVGLYGESKYATSYAIYEWLHRLGCRWYMPSELGEVIPSSPTLQVPASDNRLAPATEWRRMENRTADADFRRRNRLGGSADGGNTISAQHTLEGYITAEQREQNPDWRLVVNGQPHPRLLRWTREDVAHAIADAIIKRLDENYTPSISLSPGDYVVPTEDPEERKHDPEPRVWEPAANQWSVTDRLIMLANRVAARVGEKYPDVRFGLLAYVNYNMPPAREKVHPNVIPMLAPIDFNRHHPMTWPNHPNETWLHDLVKGWAAAAPRLAYYAYGMNLAEITAPNPFITKWGTDLPIIMANNTRYWTPETMGGWESMMPGFYLGIRMSFYPHEKPEEIIDEMMTGFYGHASEPMREYWHLIDRAWIEGNEFSGSGFGYLRIFTPEIMAQARELINQALADCRTIPEYRRVRMIDESLTNFELFMKMRHDFAAGRFRNLPADLDQWRASVHHLRSQYREQFAFDSGLAITYVNAYFGKAYEDAGRMHREYRQFAPPLVQWRYRHDPDKVAEEQGWTAPDFSDTDWPTTHVVAETWSTLGHHNTMGRMIYRMSRRIAPVPEGKRLHLWIGSTDGSAKLFVNGQHIPYTVPEKTRHHEKGATIDAFTGFCQPALFDITDAVQKDVNQITILAERTWLNELGTGGLMGPVVLFQDK